MDNLAILCVDDQTVVLEGLIEQLRSNLGDLCEIEAAESGETALEILEELQAEGIEVPLIVADQIMPGMKGDELLIRVHERYPEIVTIMLTGQASEAAISDVKEKANLHCCVRKPWNYEELMGILQDILSSAKVTSDRL